MQFVFTAIGAGLLGYMYGWQTGLGVGLLVLAICYELFLSGR